jgi:alpha/beta superfamily hydrolase
LLARVAAALGATAAAAAAAMPAIEIALPGGGAALEAELHLDRAGARRPAAALLVVHPFKLLGGSMHDAVVSEIFRQAACSNAYGAVLRYNQRGVGASGGALLALRDLRGGADAADVLAVVDFLRGHLPPPARVVVVGYSYGAMLASHVLAHPSVAAYVGVSLPLGGLAAVLRPREALARVAAARHLPRLLVLGDSDSYASVAAAGEAVAAAGGARLRDGGGAEAEDGGGAAGGAAESGDRPLRLVVWPANSHFWEQDCAAAVEHALEWAERALDLDEGEG